MEWSGVGWWSGAEGQIHSDVWERDPVSRMDGAWAAATSKQSIECTLHSHERMRTHGMATEWLSESTENKENQKRFPSKVWPRNLAIQFKCSRSDCCSYVVTKCVNRLSI